MKGQHFLSRAFAAWIGLCTMAVRAEGPLPAPLLGPAVGLRVGTLGLGGDVTVGVHERVNLRGMGSWLKFDTDGTVEEIDFTVGVNLSSYGGVVDFHPFLNNFRLSGGILLGRSSTSLRGTPGKDRKIGDHTYTPEQIGTLRGRVEFRRSYAPYFGLGYGNAVDPGQRLSFQFDLGVLFQAYRTRLTADGAASELPQFQQDLDELRQDVQDEADKLKVYPVLSIGMAYRF